MRRTQEGFSISSISFSVLQARNQLMNKGVVYTFRWARRAFFKKKKGSEERAWAKTKRTGPKIADVLIEEIDRIPVETDYLEPFADESGFPSAGAWYDKIWAMTNPHMVNSHGYIYRVTRLSQHLRSKELEK